MYLEPNSLPSRNPGQNVADCDFGCQLQFRLEIVSSNILFLDSLTVLRSRAYK